MRNVVRMAALAAALGFAAPAAAQQQELQGRVGIGLGMPTELFGSFLSSVGGGAPQIYVPINVTPSLRIEPQLGFFSDDDDGDDTSDSAFTLGAGVFWLKPVARQTQLYLGGRLSLTWTKDEERGGGGVLVKTTQRNAMLAAVLGGEYLPSPSFSVGAEAQLDFVSFGDPETRTGGTTVEGDGGSLRSTQGLLFVRVYFM